jgi:hypothetical protein
MQTFDQTLDETVTVTRDHQWQYIRVPLSVNLPAGELHLRRDTTDGPITLSSFNASSTKQRSSSLEEFFRLVDEAAAAGETLDLERSFCPPRDVEL